MFITPRHKVLIQMNGRHWLLCSCILMDIKLVVFVNAVPLFLRRLICPARTIIFFFRFYYCLVLSCTCWKDLRKLHMHNDKSM